MEKYTNKILIIAGIVVIVFTVIFVSCSVDEWINAESSYEQDYPDDYYEDDDYILDEDNY